MCSAAPSIPCTPLTSSPPTMFVATLRLDRVLFVVAGDPWQKRGRVVASSADRLELVSLALEGIDGLEASAVEIESGQASVTADTLELLAAPAESCS